MRTPPDPTPTPGPGAEQGVDAAGLRRLLLAGADAVLAEVDALTHADQAVGDGDHGIGMARGFTAVRERLAGDLEAPAALLAAVGQTLMLKVGGSSGAIFGTLFLAGSKAVDGGGAAPRQTFDAAGLARFLAAGLEAVQKRGGAKPGDKTMVDALEPAARISQAHAGGSLASALQAAAAAAAEGVQATKDMVATLGRAKTLGERALGHPDPGAMSMAIILKAMNDAMQQ